MRSAERFRFAPLHPTAHQALEYLVAAVLAYTATHYPNGSAVALLALAVVIGAIAAISPGHLALRRVLGHRARRVADAVVAAAAVAVVVLVTTTDVLPSVVLSGAAVTLVRLAFSSRPPRSTSPDRSATASTTTRAARHLEREIQPALNRAARAAGSLVRAWRSNRSR